MKIYVNGYIKRQLEDPDGWTVNKRMKKFYSKLIEGAVLKKTIKNRANESFEAMLDDEDNVTINGYEVLDVNTTFKSIYCERFGTLSENSNHSLNLQSRINI